MSDVFGWGRAAVDEGADEDTESTLTFELAGKECTEDTAASAGPKTVPFYLVSTQPAPAAVETGSEATTPLDGPPQAARIDTAPLDGPATVLLHDRRPDPVRDASPDRTAPLDTPIAPLPSSAGQPAAEDATTRFDDRGPIGRGGRATIHRVFDASLGRDVAMKLLDPNLADKTTEVETFVGEARLTSQLGHPNVIPVHDVGVDAEGRTYFLMRLVAGATLKQHVLAPEDDRTFEEKLQEFLLIHLKMCDALSFAHSRGFIHCDLKPQNVMVGEFGEVYVLDWGIAQRKAPPGKSGFDPNRRIFGTPAYMPPEQANGYAPDERTDVFALGALIYFFLTGRPPFRGQSIEECIARSRACEYVDPATQARGDVAPALFEIVRTAMARQPDARYQTVARLKEAIEAYLRGGWGFDTETFGPGEAIVTEGELGDAAYIIKRGRCAAVKVIDGTRRVLREMGPGDAFGEMAVILSGPRTASVEAIDEVTVQVITRKRMEKGLSYHPWLGRIVRTLTERFREADAELSTLKERPKS